MEKKLKFLQKHPLQEVNPSFLQQVVNYKTVTLTFILKNMCVAYYPVMHVTSVIIFSKYEFYTFVFFLNQYWKSYFSGERLAPLQR